jgi:hypothetical protein
MNWETTFKNPRTTWAGLFTALGAIADAGTQLVTGHVDPERLWLDIGVIAGGLGLVAAKDGETRSTAQEVGRAGAEAHGQ